MLSSFRQSRLQVQSRRLRLEHLEDRVQPNDMLSVGGSALLGLDSGFLFGDPLAASLSRVAESDSLLADPPARQGETSLLLAVASLQFLGRPGDQPVSDLNAPAATGGLELAHLVGSLGDDGPGVASTWFDGSLIPVENGLSQTTLVADDNGYVYSIGGGVGPGPTARINQVWAYDIGTDTWEPRASIPIADGMAGYGAAVHYAGTLYVFGGIQGAAPTVVLNTVWKYDIASDSWSQGTNLPAQRFGSAVGVIGDQIYVAGGANTAVERTTWRYDPAADTFTTLAPIPNNVPNTFRIHGAAVGNQLHAFAGGFGGVNHITYDVDTDAWTVNPRMPFGATDPGVAAVGESIYVAGGDGNIIGAGLVQVYDTTTQTWGISKFTPGPTSNTSMAYNAPYGTLHVLGGFFGGNSINVNWISAA